MTHTHNHDEEIRTYYLDQLCTIGASAGLGVVMILLWSSGDLGNYLDKSFHLPVLLAGITLLVVVAIRAVSLWISVGKLRATAGHDHNHDHEHCHDHDHCDHEHGEDHDHDESHDHDNVHLPLVADDHGHEHGWAPWRYAVMIVPVIIFMLGISGAEAEPPEEGVTVMKQVETDSLVSNWKNMDPREREQRQKEWNETDVRVRGLVMEPFKDTLEDHSNSSDKLIWLGRKQMTCCIGDAYPIKSRVLMELTPEMRTQWPRNQWVKVKGTMKFYRVAGTDSYVAVVKAKDVVPLDRIPSVLDP